VTHALSVGPGVIRETVRLAALEVPGVVRVGRGGPRWRDVLGGSPIRVRIRDGRVDVTLRLVVRPRQPLVPLTAHVREAVAAAVERVLGMEPGAVTVLVEAVPTVKTPGVGLGLAITADIARSHGGQLRLGESAGMGGLKAELVLSR